jgi:hypothetical protein
VAAQHVLWDRRHRGCSVASEPTPRVADAGVETHRGGGRALASSLDVGVQCGHGGQGVAEAVVDHLQPGAGEGPGNRSMPSRRRAPRAGSRGHTRPRSHGGKATGAAAHLRVDVVVGLEHRQAGPLGGAHQLRGRGTGGRMGATIAGEKRASTNARLPGRRAGAPAALRAELQHCRSRASSPPLWGPAAAHLAPEPPVPLYCAGLPALSGALHGAEDATGCEARRCAEGVTSPPAGAPLATRCVVRMYLGGRTARAGPGQSPARRARKACCGLLLL